MNTDEILKVLAAMERPCQLQLGPFAGAHIGSGCQYCKGAGTVPAFLMLRVECRPLHNFFGGPIKPCSHGCIKEDDKTCPGWRAKTLDEARLCLEELLATEKVTVQPTLPQHERKHAWYASIGNIEYYKDAFGDTPTEAVLAALYEASKVKTDA